MFGFFLESMEDVDRFGKPNCVNGSPCISPMIRDDFNNRPAAESFHRFGCRIGLALLRGIEGHANVAPYNLRKLAQISPAGANPDKRTYRPDHYTKLRLFVWFVNIELAAAADFSRVRDADLSRFTLDRRVSIINWMDSRIEVEVSVRRPQFAARISSRTMRRRVSSSLGALPSTCWRRASLIRV